jgi:hypothetical protein
VVADFEPDCIARAMENHAAVAREFEFDLGVVRLNWLFTRGADATAPHAGPDVQCGLGRQRPANDFVPNSFAEGI